MKLEALDLYLAFGRTSRNEKGSLCEGEGRQKGETF